jgi:uncharacterized protein (TIGR04255 family)
MHYEIFPNAPITEALIDIKVTLPKELSLNDLKQLQVNIKARFPEVTEKRFFRAALKLGQEPSYTPEEHGIMGYQFRSQQDKKVVQYTLEGFTFNKLKPYENWSKMKSEAMELWETYFKSTEPVKITRIALRYINRIEIPIPIKDFSEYFFVSPKIADMSMQSISNFLMRIETQNDKIPASAIITQAMERPTESQKIPFIFDIDVFRQTDYRKNEKKMWQDFDKLRQFKNEIFFSNITNRTKDFFR